MVLVTAFLCVGVFQLFGLPRLLPVNPWWALLLVPSVLSTTTNWSLIHEAIHRLLVPSRRLNDVCGRALAVFFGSPFELLRFPHLEHHRLNGTVADRPEHYEHARLSRCEATLRYYPRLVVGIYATELAGTLICLMPNLVLRRVVRLFPKVHEDDDRAETYLLKRGRLAQFRFDACCVITLYAVAFWCYGTYWPLLALSILARGVIVSIADNSYHYGAPLGAGPRSAYNLRLPGGAGILHFNLHRVHHLHPTLPWSGLPAAFEADAERYDVGYASAMLRQFRGPISDRDYARTS
jgi:fatty acid desaturase